MASWSNGSGGQLRAHGLPADAITLEVTETETMADLASGDPHTRGAGVARRRHRHRRLRHRAFLARLPPHASRQTELKIDRSFVTNLPNEPSNKVIVRATIEMAHRLGLKVVAEGAEDEVTCAMLAEAGCDMIQGYYLSKPLAPTT